MALFEYSWPKDFILLENIFKLATYALTSREVVFMGARHHAVVGWGVVLTDTDDFLQARDNGYEDVSYIWAKDSTPLTYCSSGHNNDFKEFVIASSTSHMVGVNNRLPWNIELDLEDPTEKERQAMREFIERFDVPEAPSWRLNGSLE